jgi:oxygen-independent coproporphyrinogen III oxidase
MSALRSLVTESPYQGYAYAYPHKSAYRRLQPTVPLRNLWAAEDRSRLFLYLHVPFCEMRCGFCNLFTIANPRFDLPEAYLAAFRRQARVSAEAVLPARVARVAIGGGTPTHLSPPELHALLDVAERDLGAALEEIPVSVETSPVTADDARLTVLRERGVDRISLGVQSFLDSEAAAAGRPQSRDQVEGALERIRQFGFPVLNVDLIYGLPGQTAATWVSSLHAALDYQPEELYLYPLYLRPETGLHRRGVPGHGDARLALYRLGRDLLLDAGYEQVSMRMFSRSGSAGSAEDSAYCCQEDGMLGIGCGARSYTQAVHYSTEYAVGRRGVKEILQRYVGMPSSGFAVADYGVRLDDEEQRRRHAIKSLLRCEGLSGAAYRQRFGTDVSDDLPELSELTASGLGEWDGDVLGLTPGGLECSDAIGPWLYSARVRATMEAFELR